MARFNFMLLLRLIFVLLLGCAALQLIVKLAEKNYHKYKKSDRVAVQAALALGMILIGFVPFYSVIRPTLPSVEETEGCIYVFMVVFPIGASLLCHWLVKSYWGAVYASIPVAVSFYFLADMFNRLAYQGSEWKQYLERIPSHLNYSVLRTAPVALAASFFIGKIFMHYRNKTRSEAREADT